MNASRLQMQLAISALGADVRRLEAAGKDATVPKTQLAVDIACLAMTRGTERLEMLHATNGEDRYSAGAAAGFLRDAAVTLLDAAMVLDAAAGDPLEAVLAEAGLRNAE